MRHDFTKKGYKWEHVHGPERVGPLDLDVGDVANRKDCIVALVHGKTDGEELPVPLGMEPPFLSLFNRLIRHSTEVNRLGDKSCCSVSTSSSMSSTSFGFDNIEGSIYSGSAQFSMHYFRVNYLFIVVQLCDFDLGRLSVVDHK
jgi:hypothetical protein